MAIDYVIGVRKDPATGQWLATTDPVLMSSLEWDSHPAIQDHGINKKTTTREYRDAVAQGLTACALQCNDNHGVFELKHYVAAMKSAFAFN